MSIIPREVQEKWDKEKTENKDKLKDLIQEGVEKLKQRQAPLSPYTSHGKSKVIKTIRSCFTCKLSTVCFAYINIKETLVKLPVNIDTDEAPMRQTAVFKALAGCCLVYEENN